MTVTGNFERFHYLNFGISFKKKTKSFYWKTGVPFLVESTTMKNATFPNKTALSKAKVRTNRMGSTKWTFPR